MASTFADGLRDIQSSLRQRSVWIALASEDITDQHRRTTLGPIWLFINYLAFAGTFIAIFSGREVNVNYPAYVALGLFVWLFMLEVVTQSITLFSRDEGFIKGTTLPLSVYVMRLFVQSVIRSLYALAGCLLVLLIYGISLTGTAVAAIGGCLVILAAAPAVILVLAMTGAFFPDVQFLVINAMRLGMFLTPIFWVDDGRSGIRQILSQWNPFAYFIEIVRAPLLADTIPYNAFGICLAIVAVMWLLAVYLLGKNRKKVAFVL